MIIVALDTHSLLQARQWVSALRNCSAVTSFKVGLQLCNAAGGPFEVCETLSACGAEQLMLDLKLHDIPNTVGSTLRNMRSLQSWGTTVHATAGAGVIRAAAEHTDVIAVTVLTSISEDECHAIYRDGPRVVVPCLAELAVRAGAKGIVCAPVDLPAVRERIGNDVTILTPGVRPLWAARDDQKRVTTPKEAIDMGADYVVIGRPITYAPDGMTPQEAVTRIVEEF
jgi:orotidine-5'-phosphate decarboxylase